MHVSLVIPAYNESQNLAPLMEVITVEMEKNTRAKLCDSYEVIIVDDGSTDTSGEILALLRESYSELIYLSLSRNFGHQVALRAGMDQARGDVVLSLDADLQHPPHLISTLLRKHHDGYDIVYTRRTDTDMSLFKRWTSALFYMLVNTLSDIHIDYGTADFRLVSRRVADLIKQSVESPLFLRGYIAWSGFSQCGIDYTPHKRHQGKSKYTLLKMISLSLDGLTAFSIRPLRFATVIGFFMSAVAGLYGLYAIWVYFFSNRVISGWASVLLSVLFVGGLQLIILGIIGEYIGRTFVQSKQRPAYIIKYLSHS